MSVMEERLTLTTKELKRLKILAWIEGEQMTVMQAAEVLGVRDIETCRGTSWPVILPLLNGVGQGRIFDDLDKELVA